MKTKSYTATATDAGIHLSCAYPYLARFFKDLGPISMPVPPPIPVPEAVVRVVIGQMLSRVAAKTIYSRVAVARERLGLPGSWSLPSRELIGCGLSKRKERTIKAFAEVYEKDPQSIENWRFMSNNELVKTVRSFWGLSEWSANILSIFYFCDPDVFPTTDASITRAITTVEERFLGNSLNFDPEYAKPFRSYLSLYLWKSLDAGYWRSNIPALTPPLGR